MTEIADALKTGIRNADAPVVAAVPETAMAPKKDQQEMVRLLARFIKRRAGGSPRRAGDDNLADESIEDEEVRDSVSGNREE